MHIWLSIRRIPSFWLYENKIAASPPFNCPNDDVFKDASWLTNHRSLVDKEVAESCDEMYMQILVAALPPSPARENAI